MLGSISELVSHRTVIILGAGASAEYKLPLGPELKREIINVAHSGHISELHRTAGDFDQNALTRLADSLAGTSHETIDAFLARKPSLRGIGCFVAAMAIMKSEHIANQHMFPLKGWYGRLYAELSLEDPTHGIDNLSIVTLNYDRTLEHFLNKTITLDCDESKEATARSSLDRIKIIHAHGSIGDYTNVGFPAVFSDPKTVKNAANNLRIISDNLYESAAYRDAQALVARAENVVIFGFGYHEQTVHGLFKNVDPSKQVIFGTRFKYKGVDPKELFSKWKTHFGSDSQSCSDYLSELTPELIRSHRLRN